MGNQILMVYTFCSWYIWVVVCHTERAEIILCSSLLVESYLLWQMGHQYEIRISTYGCERPSVKLSDVFDAMSLKYFISLHNPCELEISTRQNIHQQILYLTSLVLWQWFCSLMYDDLLGCCRYMLVLMPWMGNQILMVYTFCSWYIGVVVCHTENTEIIYSNTDLTDPTDLLLAVHTVCSAINISSV